MGFSATSMNESMMESFDDASVSDGSSTSDPSTTLDTNKSDSTPVSLTHKETKAVNRSKALVYLALLVAAISVGVGTYFVFRNAESRNFETSVSTQSYPV